MSKNSHEQLGMSYGEQRLRRQLKKDNADVIGPMQKFIPPNRISLHHSYGMSAAINIDDDVAYRREL